MAESQVRHVRWADVPVEPVTPQLTRQLVTGAREMLARITLTRGAVVPLHQHESEQLTCVLDGALRFTIGGRDLVVRGGEVLVIPSNVPHAAEALVDTVELDLFSPIRQDWLDGTDDYFRREPGMPAPASAREQ
jgi:quercetin dioxygenase-like cupin family protein